MIIIHIQHTEGIKSFIHHTIGQESFTHHTIGQELVIHPPYLTIGQE